MYLAPANSRRPRLARRLCTTAAALLLLVSQHFPVTRAEARSAPAPAAQAEQTAPVEARATTAAPRPTMQADRPTPQARLWAGLRPPVAANDEKKARLVAGREPGAARRLHRELVFEAFESKLYGNPQMTEAEAARQLLATTDGETRALEAKLSEWLERPEPGVGIAAPGARPEQFFYLAAVARARDKEAESLPEAPRGTPRELIEQARSLASVEGDELAAASFAGTLSVYALRERRLEEVGPLLSAAEATWQVWGHQVGLFQAPLVRGHAAYAREDWREAAAQLGRAAELARAMEELRSERVGALSGRAAALRQAGEKEEVFRSLSVAVEEQRKVLAGAADDDSRLKHSKTLADLETQAGGALAGLGRHGEAADWYARADELKRRNYEIERAAFRRQLEEFRATMSKRVAEAAGEEHKAIFRRVTETGLDSYLSILDSLASQNNDAGGAAAVASERLALAREGGDPLNVASALEAVAKTELKAGGLAKARAAAEEAQRLRRSDPRRTRLYQSVQLLAEIADAAEDWKEARSRYLEAAELARPGALPVPYDLSAQPDENIRRIQARMNDFDLLVREKAALDSRLALAHVETRLGNYRAADELLRSVERDLSRLYAAGASDSAKLLNLVGAGDLNLSAVAADRRARGFTPDAGEEQRLGFADLAARQQRALLLSYRAMLLEEQNDLDGAARAYEQANVVSANLVGGAFRLSGTYVALARIERERGNYDAAEPPVRAALEEAAGRNDAQTMAALLSFLSALSRDRGRHEEALGFASDAHRLAAKTGTRTQAAAALRTLGRAEGSLGGERLASSEKHLREALNIWRELGLRAHAAYTLDSLGQTLEKMGREEEALETYREGVEIVESLVSSLPAGASAETFSAGRGNRELYEHLIRLLVKKNRASEALQYLDRSKSKALVDALAGTNVTASDPRLAALLLRVRESAAALHSAEKRLADESGRVTPGEAGGPGDVASRVAALRAQAAAAQKAHAASVEELRRLSPAHAALVAVTPPDLEGLRRLLPQNTLLLSFYPTDAGLYVFTLTRDRPAGVQVSRATRAELSRLVAEYRALVAPKDEGADATNDATKDATKEPGAGATAAGGAKVTVRGLGAARAVGAAGGAAGGDLKRVDELTARLYETLLAPARAEIERAETILLVPSGDLYFLPIHALGPARADGSIEYLVETKRFAYLASADLLGVLAERAGGDGREAGTNAGARADAGTVAEAGPGGGASLVALGNPDGSLPGATDEVRALSAVFPRSRVYTGEQATIERVAGNRTAGVPFVHFATHGRIDSRDPKETYLLLAGSPGRLSVRDLVEDSHQLSFDGTRLVTLSACNTNVGGFDPSAAYGSLSRAFSKAGAPSVVASLWSVDDEATRDTMSLFYRELAAGTPKAEALRRAQLSLMRDPARRHPFFWAPFVVLGEWR
ncbi:MAG TPA: CHAT domain-containing protein [Pyrinomonadaceae bacterium]|nr:CHAT domain-containing protein [Pyrinomonadaceae bacterium]